MLAIFDLDNTLLAGDSDYLWGQFLVEKGAVDGIEYERQNQRFYDEYRQGLLDIQEFLSFSLKPLAENPLETLLSWRAEFMERKMRPIILESARALLARHRGQGDTLLIVTATNRFVTEPLAEALGVDELLATEPEWQDGRYTGRVVDTPCFREGKLTRVQRWLRGTDFDLARSSFYSDSHNDLPLLEAVGQPVAVDPDATLQRHAESRGWPIITLRSAAG
jgi:HAD superfamily hydrolase (TIGR01490 family)